MLSRMNLRQIMRPYTKAERMLIVTGFVLAGAVASYATAMLTDDTHVPYFPGSEHLNIFSRPASVAHGRPFARKPNPNAIAEGPMGFDPTPIGSVRRLQEEAPPPDDRQNRLGAFFVRGIYGGKALVQTADGFVMVEIGTEIPGAGAAEKIEFRAGEWVVVTSQGFIGQRKP